MLNFVVNIARYLEIQKDAVWLLIDKPFRAMERLFIFGYLAKVLDIYSFGLIIEISALYLLPSFFLEPGLRPLIQMDNSNGVIHEGSYRKLRAIGGIGYVLAISILAYFSVDDSDLYRLVLIIVALRALLIVDYRQFILLASKRFKDYALREIFSIIVPLIMIIIALYFTKDIYVILSLVLSGKILKSFLYIVRINSPELRNSSERFSEKFRQALPWIFANIAGILLLRIDTFMIDILLGDPVQSAQYGLAATVNEFWWFLPTALGTYWSKSIIEETKKANTRRKYLFNLSMALLFAVGIFTGGSVLVDIVFGENYAGVPRILRILSIAGIGVAIFPLLKWNLAGFNKSHVFTILQVTALIVNIVLNLILIPNYGLEGAAIGTALSLNGTILTYFIVKKGKVS